MEPIAGEKKLKKASSLKVPFRMLPLLLGWMNGEKWQLSACFIRSNKRKCAKKKQRSRKEAQTGHHQKILFVGVLCREKIINLYQTAQLPPRYRFWAGWWESLDFLSIQGWMGWTVLLQLTTMRETMRRDWVHVRFFLCFLFESLEFRKLFEKHILAGVKNKLDRDEMQNRFVSSWFLSGVENAIHLRGVFVIFDNLTQR